MSGEPLLAASLGDPAGISPELFLKLWLAGAPYPFFLTARVTFLERWAARLDLAVPLASIANPAEARKHFAHALPILPIDADMAGIMPGVPSEGSGVVAWASLEAAYRQVRDGVADGLITGVVSKEHLALAGFRWAGQTEWLAHQCQREALMMLATPALRTALATIHIPLASVSEALAQLGVAGLVQKLHQLAAALRQDFGIAKPRLALAALNPHAGENGLIGSEEQDILIPAAERARVAGLTVSNPLPADSLFMPAMRETYDAVLCLYHDQALIALKTLDFAHGVNISLGLPIIRTSPDHGAAFALAVRGKGEAPPSITPLYQAMKVAGEIVIQRGKA